MFQLPVELKAALGFLITNGIKSLVELFGGSLGGKWAAIVAAIVGALLLFGESLIALTEPDTQEGIVAVLQLIVTILSMFGIHRTGKMLAGLT